MASTESQPQLAAGTPKASPQITSQDIVFQCPGCDGQLVVDQAGAGMECPCAHCGVLLVIPARSAAPPVPEPVLLPTLAVPPTVEPPKETLPQRQFDFTAQTSEQLTRRLEELKHQLKENLSQDTEMRGHVNRATIELHRLQLRLKKLQDRQADIEAEMSAARNWLQSLGG